MGGAGAQALAFLVDTLGGFFGALFLLRFFMQARRVSFANPLGHFVIQLSNWAVLPLRRLIPGLGGFDWASLVAALLLEIVQLVATLGLAGVLPAVSPVFLVLGALLGLVRLAVRLSMVALIVMAVLSWVNPYSPLSGPLNQLTRPILAPIQRLIPPIAGIDLAPLIALLLLQLLLIFL